MTLSTVLQKLKEAGLVLNEKKFNFRQTSLRFLGHTINAKGILPDQEHLDTVRNAPPPSDAASLQSFLRLVLWYSKFLPGFATVVAPMRECAKEKGQFAWTPAAQNSFEDIKRMLVSSPALAIYDPTLHSVISTDASDYGLGAVFAQIQSNRTEKPSQVTYVTMVPRVGNETLRPLGVATGNALSVTRSEDTYEKKTPPVGRRQPMTSLPAYHNISAAGRIHHQLLRLKLASEAWLKAQGTQCLVPHSGNHGYIRNLRRSPSWELELRPLGVATGNVIPTSPC